MNKHEKYKRHPGMKYCYVILETHECQPTGNLGLMEHTHTHTQCGCASVRRLYRDGQGDNSNDGGFVCSESNTGLMSAGGG